MSSLPFLLPFAHWPPDTSFVPRPSTVTVAKFLPQWLLLGLSCGGLLLVSTGVDPNGVRLSPHARLSGHKAAVIALDTLPARTEGGEELLLVSLDSVGRMSKWSLSDGRCLQSVSSTISSRPRGFRVVGRRATGTKDGEAPDLVIIVYGCSTEIVVLNAETLGKILLWTGGVDWPLPAVAGGGREILALTPEGKVQGWILEKRSPPEGHRPMAATIGLKKNYQRQFGIEKRDEWGAIVGFERASEKDYILVQRRGVRIYAAEGPHSFTLQKSIEMDEGTDISGFEAFEKKGLVFVWASDGNSRILQRGGEGLWGCSGTLARPESMGEGGEVVVMAFTERKGDWVVAAFSQSASDKRKRLASSASRGGLAIGMFSLKDGGGDIEWNSNNEALFSLPPSPDEAPLSTCSAIFANMMVFAHGCLLRLHTLSSFLLSYDDPIKKIYIPATGRICLLKRFRVGEYVGSGRHSGIQGGKEYLVVGSTSGELFIVEAPSFKSTKRLPLSATPISSANLLPSNLGKRLRSTLLISSADGTASIVDVECARIMTTFPSHDYLQLVSFATKTSQNIVLLTYEDSAKREWNLGEEEGAVLKSPPPSRGSDRGGGVYAADLADEGWREVRVGGFEIEEEDREEEGEGSNGDGTMKACERFCEEGLPTAVVDVKSVLDTLRASIDVAKQRTRRNERVVVGNHPALITARSLLTALIPGGIEELVGWEEGYDWKTSVADHFFRRKTLAVLGQIGAGRHISLLSPEAATHNDDRVWGIGNTVTSIVLLAALSLVGGLLEAAGKEEYFETVVEKALDNQKGAKRVPALGVFAKYWMDRNSLVRKVARMCMHICMQRLTHEQRVQAVGYWSRFLPVLVPPELFSSKDVVRSVVILGKLTADYSDMIDLSVKKNVALSVELLLGDRNPHFQDTAIELVGDGWSVFQSLFDPAEVIHILIRISSSPPDEFLEARRKTLHDCILSIARLNSPLLGSGLAGNIAHGTSSPSQINATTMSTAFNICVAAMRIVTVVVREDAILFRDVLNLIVAAVVKILDPSSPLREKVLPTVTELVNEMVEAYPSITFHRPTQRLALSVSPGVIFIFDLKSATEINILQGHHNLANFLSFNIDGKYLVAVDLEEDIFFVWKIVTGILSFIGGSDGPPSVLQPKRGEKFKNSKKVGVVDVDWTGEKSVKVIAGTEVTEIANVEGGRGDGWGIL